MELIKKRKYEESDINILNKKLKTTHIANDNYNINLQYLIKKNKLLEYQNYRLLLYINNIENNNNNNYTFSNEIY